MSSQEQRTRLRNVGIAGVAALAGSVLLYESLKPPAVEETADKIAATVSAELHPHGKVAVAPMVVAIDGHVNYRATPAKINTLNTALITSNKVAEHFPQYSTLEWPVDRPTILVRPVVVKNEEQFSDTDPAYWLGGLSGDHLVWVGVNQETAQHMRFFQQAGAGESFAETVQILQVNQENGIVFASDGYVASAGLLRASIGTHDPYLEQLHQRGYQETQNPFPAN